MTNTTNNTRPPLTRLETWLADAISRTNIDGRAVGSVDWVQVDPEILAGFLNGGRG